MKAAIGCMLAFALLSGTGCSDSGHDFNSVVAGVEQRYSVHAQRVPLMGFVSLCARAKTHGGVTDMHIAEFDRIGKIDAEKLDSMMQSELGAEWQPMVKDWGRNRSSLSIIFVRPSPDASDSRDAAHSMAMVIADYDHGELDLVGLDMNGSALAKWMQNPQAGNGLFHPHPAASRQTD